MPVFFIAPRKFVEFEYYYLPLVPPFAMLAGMAACAYFNSAFGRRWGRMLLLAAVVLLAGRYALPPILKVPAEDRHVIPAGEEIQARVPKDARIIVSHGSSSVLLYYANRDGWNIYLKKSEFGGVRNLPDKIGTPIERLERFRTQGGAFYAISDKNQIKENPEFFSYLSEHYSKIHESRHAIIYSLN